MNGKTSSSVLTTEDFQAKENADDAKKPQELYTLSAQLVGEGGIEIADSSTVILGTPKTIYTIEGYLEKDDGTFEVKYKDAAPNEYTGQTILHNGSWLVAGIDGALGSNSIYTRL